MFVLLACIPRFNQRINKNIRNLLRFNFFNYQAKKKPMSDIHFVFITHVGTHLMQYKKVAIFLYKAL